MATTVAQLIDRSKALADKRNDASIPDTDWLTYVNWGVEDLYRLLVSIDPAVYFSSFDFSLTGGLTSAATFALTSVTGGLRAMHGLDLSPDTTLRRTVPRRNFRERNMGRIGWWSPTLFAIDRGYDLRGTSLVVTPYEFAAGSYRVYYRAAPYNFVSAVDGTTLDAQLDAYNEWIVLKAARKGLKIEESDSAPWTEEIESLRESIMSAHERDDTEPTVLADVEGDSGGTWGWP
jgi:hypothetical protein